MPDLQNVLKAPLPPVFTENGREALMVDFEAYRRAPDKEAFRQVVYDYIGALPQPEEENAILKQDVIQSFANVDAARPPFEQAGMVIQIYPPDQTGAIAQRLVFTDSTRAPADTLNAYSWKFTVDVAEAETYNTLIFEHERAHAFYDLDESGAAYMSTVETLVKMPQGRPMLEFAADCELVKTILDAEVKPILAEIYGHETYMAMRAALALPQTELDRLAALDPEERRAALVPEAVNYDEIGTEFYRLLPEARAPEMRVRGALQARELGIPLPETLSDTFRLSSGVVVKVTDMQIHDPRRHLESYHAAKDLLENHNPFKPDGALEDVAAYEMLKDFVAAMERVTVTGYGPQTPDAGAVQTPAPTTAFRP